MKKDVIIEDMNKKGIKWIFVGGVDNILLKIVDPILTGVTIEENLEDVLANKKVTVRVTITWDNDSDNENAADTANGVTAADIKVPVTITAKQHIG